MTLSALVNPTVLSQPVYEPGKPIEDVARELGLDPAGIIKLASNENPLGPSPLAVAAATRALAQSELYPDGGCVALRQKLALRFGLAPEQFVVGNGSNELLELLGHVFLEQIQNRRDRCPVARRLARVTLGGDPVGEVEGDDHVPGVRSLRAGGRGLCPG